MKTFADVIAAFPDDSLASGLGVNKSLVAVWKHRKRIPREYWVSIIALKRAKAQGITGELLKQIEAERKRVEIERKRLEEERRREEARRRKAAA